VRKDPYKPRRYRTPPKGTVAYALHELARAKRLFWLEVGRATGAVRLLRWMSRRLAR
jgi:hypothetical protein